MSERTTVQLLNSNHVFYGHFWSKCAPSGPWVINDQFYMTNFIWPTFVIYLVWRKAFWLTSRSNWSYVSHFIELSHFYAISYEPYHIYAAGNHIFLSITGSSLMLPGAEIHGLGPTGPNKSENFNFVGSDPAWAEIFKFFLVQGPDRTARSWTNLFESV